MGYSSLYADTLNLLKYSYKIGLGDTYTLEPSFSPEKQTARVTYSSSDPQIIHLRMEKKKITEELLDEVREQYPMPKYEDFANDNEYERKTT